MSALQFAVLPRRPRAVREAARCYIVEGTQFKVFIPYSVRQPTAGDIRTYPNSPSSRIMLLGREVQVLQAPEGRKPGVLARADIPAAWLVELDGEVENDD